MVTIHREFGMRFVINVDDHMPAHVHVLGDGEARIEIESLEVMSSNGWTKRDVARAKLVIQRGRDLFLKRWTDIHGSG